MGTKCRISTFFDALHLSRLTIVRCSDRITETWLRIWRARTTALRSWGRHDIVPCGAVLRPVVRGFIPPRGRHQTMMGLISPYGGRPAISWSHARKGTNSGYMPAAPLDSLSMRASSAMARASMPRLAGARSRVSPASMTRMSVPSIQRSLWIPHCTPPRRTRGPSSNTFWAEASSTTKEPLYQVPMPSAREVDCVGKSDG